MNGRKMRVLVLGGAGFIGRHVVELFRSLGTKVAVLDVVPKAHYSVCNVTYYQGDFSDFKDIAECMESSGATHVVHLVSTTLPKTSNDNMIYDIQSNVMSTVRLLDLCVKHRLKKIVFMSSGGTVYGKSHTLPIEEGHPTDPICSYGITKLTIEKFIQLYSREHGIDHVILRPSNPYGPGQNPSSGQGVITTFLGKIANRQPLEVWGDGSTIRDYFHVSDLANLTCQATLSDATGVFNAGSGSGTSINQLITVIGEILGVNPEVNFLPARTFDVPAIVLDRRKAHDAFGWVPKISLEGGIRRYLADPTHVASRSQS